MADNYHKNDNDHLYEFYRTASKESQYKYQKEKNSVNDLIYTAQIKKQKDRSDATELRYHKLKLLTIFLAIILILSCSFFICRAKKRKAIFT